MRADLTEALERDFPILYRLKRGFSCGDGWELLLRRLSAVLEPILAATPASCFCGHLPDDHLPEGCIFATDFDAECCCPAFEDSRPAVVDVKEKFGTLRYYMSSEDTPMTAAIRRAEEESHRTCEPCGAPGQLRQGSWLKVRCDTCEAEKRSTRSLA